MMKKTSILTFLLFAVGWTGGFLPAKGQDVATIRQQYSEVHQLMDLQKEEIHLQNEVRLTLQHNVPGIGPQRIDYQLLLTPYRHNEMGDLQPHTLRFATANYDIAAAHFYEEFLYDKDGFPIFIYARHPLMETAKTMEEVRIYLDGKRPFKIMRSRKTEGSEAVTEQLPLASSLPPRMEALLQRAEQLHKGVQTMNECFIP